MQCDLPADGAYFPAELRRDPNGTIRGHSQLLGLDIYVTPGEGRLRLYDPVKETWLRNLPESEAALQSEEAAHTATKADLLLAESRVSIAENRAVRAETRAADAESEREAAQERIRQLEEQLRRQQSP